MRRGGLGALGASSQRPSPAVYSLDPDKVAFDVNAALCNFLAPAVFPVNFSHVLAQMGEQGELGALSTNPTLSPGTTGTAATTSAGTNAMGEYLPMEEPTDDVLRGLAEDLLSEDIAVRQTALDIIRVILLRTAYDADRKARAHLVPSSSASSTASPSPAPFMASTTTPTSFSNRSIGSGGSRPVSMRQLSPADTWEPALRQICSRVLAADMFDSIANLLIEAYMRAMSPASPATEATQNQHTVSETECLTCLDILYIIVIILSKQVSSSSSPDGDSSDVGVIEQTITTVFPDLPHTLLLLLAIPIPALSPTVHMVHQASPQLSSPSMQMVRKLLWLTEAIISTSIGSFAACCAQLESYSYVRYGLPIPPIISTAATAQQPISSPGIAILPRTATLHEAHTYHQHLASKYPLVPAEPVFKSKDNPERRWDTVLLSHSPHFCDVLAKDAIHDNPLRTLASSCQWPSENQQFQLPVPHRSMGQTDGPISSASAIIDEILMSPKSPPPPAPVLSPRRSADDISSARPQLSRFALDDDTLPLPVVEPRPPPSRTAGESLSPPQSPRSLTSGSSRDDDSDCASFGLSDLSRRAFEDEEATNLLMTVMDETFDSDGTCSCCNFDSEVGSDATTTTATATDMEHIRVPHLRPPLPLREAVAHIPNVVTVEPWQVQVALARRRLARLRDGWPHMTPTIDDLNQECADTANSNNGINFMRARVLYDRVRALLSMDGSMLSKILERIHQIIVLCSMDISLQQQLPPPPSSINQQPQQQQQQQQPPYHFNYSPQLYQQISPSSINAHFQPSQPQSHHAVSRPNERLYQDSMLAGSARLLDMLLVLSRNVHVLLQEAMLLILFHRRAVSQASSWVEYTGRRFQSLIIENERVRSSSMNIGSLLPSGGTDMNSAIEGSASSTASADDFGANGVSLLRLFQTRNPSPQLRAFNNSINAVSSTTTTTTTTTTLPSTANESTGSQHGQFSSPLSTAVSTSKKPTLILVGQGLVDVPPRARNAGIASFHVASILRHCVYGNTQRQLDFDDGAIRLTSIFNRIDIAQTRALISSILGIMRPLLVRVLTNSRETMLLNKVKQQAISNGFFDGWHGATAATSTTSASTNNGNNSSHMNMNMNSGGSGSTSLQNELMVIREKAHIAATEMTTLLEGELGPTFDIPSITHDQHHHTSDEHLHSRGSIEGISTANTLNVTEASVLPCPAPIFY
ncbi:hypothetical protein GQ42DRAFT_177809 [Ramicandelaber brevisporus]|nr:hypothetical protein GQ42DRAFT_177809 [Ramicandelaber brevisporus]